MTEWRGRDLLGKVVTVQNPHIQNTAWTGELIAYSDSPCVTLEFENGERMCLPADWVQRPEERTE